MLLYDLILGGGLVFWALITFLYVRHPAASLLHPGTFYLLFHFIVFAARPVFARIYDYEGIYRQFGFQPSWSEKITVLLAADLGLATFMAVLMLVAREPLSFPRGIKEQLHRRALQKPFLLACLLIVPVGLASSLSQWSTRATDSSSMVRDLATGAAVNTQMNGWFFSSQLALVPLAVMFVWIFRFRWWSLIPFAMFFVLRAGTGGRGPLIVAAFALIILFLIENRRRWPEWRSAALVGAVALVFTTVVADRGKAVRELFIEDETVSGEAFYESAPFETMDFANQEFFEYLVYAIPHRTGTYDYFLSNLQILTEPIPRVWWKEKPVGPPIQLFSLFDYGAPLGMTQSLPGAGWTSMGWLGVMIQCGVFALLYGMLYRWLAMRRYDNFALLTYALMIAATTITFRDGVLITVVRLLPFYIGPIVLVWILARFWGVRGPDEQLKAQLSKAGSHAKGLTPAERRRRRAEAAQS